mgnify:CR=1 FL=1
MKYLKATISLFIIIAVLLNWNFLLAGGKTTSNVTDVDRDNEPEYWDRADENLLDLTADITVSAWINGETFAGAGGGWNAIVAKGDHTTGYDFHFLTEDGARFRVFQGGAGILTHNVTLTAGTWYHVAYVCDDAGGAGSASIYFNGTGTSTGTCTVNNNNTIEFRVGSTEAATSRNWDGQLADIRIWSRVLTATEITDVRVDPCNFANGASLVGQWLFDEGTGTSAADESANALTLTGVNTPAWVTSAPYTACAGAGGAPPEVPQIIWFE